jgi:RNA polymerase sigma-70 factor (ECF subfamily)
MKELDIKYIAKLVTLASRGDSNAFAELYTLTYQKTYNYARHYLRDDFLAQDALQEIYITALRNIASLNDPSLFQAWLNQISFHTCFDMDEKRKRGASREMDPELMELMEDTSPNANLQQDYENREETHRLWAALETLPPQEKQVLVMRFYNNMKLEEIASAMDISRSSVKRYIAQGQEKLRKIMKD